jgi:hypothetical protein
MRFKDRLRYNIDRRMTAMDNLTAELNRLDEALDKRHTLQYDEDDQQSAIADALEKACANIEEATIIALEEQ